MVDNQRYGGDKSEMTDTGTRRRDQPDPEREDPSIAGQPEVTAMDEGANPPDDAKLPTGRTEEREERQHARQQHGDTFAVDDEQSDAGRSDHPGSNRVTALPGNEPDGEND